MYSEIGYLMRNFANKIQDVKQKATLWYSKGGVERSGNAIICDGRVKFDFVDLQSTKWPVPLDNE